VIVSILQRWPGLDKLDDEEADGHIICILCRKTFLVWRVSVASVSWKYWIIISWQVLYIPTLNICTRHHKEGENPLRWCESGFGNEEEPLRYTEKRRDWGTCLFSVAMQGGRMTGRGDKSFLWSAVITFCDTALKSTMVYWEWWADFISILSW